MTKEAFYREIRERIKEFLPEQFQEADVIVREFDISGIKRPGMGVVQKGQEKVPALDLVYFWEDIQAGKDMEDVLRELGEAYTQLCENPPPVKSVSMTKGEFMESLHVSVIHFDSHKDILAQAPYLKINDLAVVPMFIAPNGESIPLSLENLEQMEESADWILAKAIKNHVNVLPPVLLKLPENVGGKLQIMDLDKRDALDPSAIYVLTNRKKEYGAAAIADKGILEQISQRLGKGFYILPDSRHELLLVPQGMGADPDVLKAMTEENAKERNPKEFLSANIYYYDDVCKEVGMYDGKRNREKVKGCTSRDER